MPASAEALAGWHAGTAHAHHRAVAAAVEGLRDPALGLHRVEGPGVLALAEAAVSSATPFLRAPLLAAIHDALVLHTGDEDGRCGTCRTPIPCPTQRALGGW